MSSSKRDEADRRRKSRSRSSSRSRSWSRSPRRGRRSYSRSYSRSRSRSRDRYRSRSRSPYYNRRSRSPYDRRRSYSPPYRRRRSNSRSPFSSRRRHDGNRFNPTRNNVIGVFGLSLNTNEDDIRDIFEKYGKIDNIQIVYDNKTHRSRGFAFVYYVDTADAVEAKESCNGIEVDGRKIRVDYSITKRAHTPTPGVYMGKPTSSNSSRRRDRHDDYDDRRY